MKKFIIHSIGIIVIALVVASCTNTQKINQTTNSKLYKKNNNELQAKYIVYHINDTVSDLHYSINNDILVYKKSDTSDYFYSHLKLIIRVKNENALEKSEHTSTFDIYDRQTDVKSKELNGFVSINLKQGLNYLIDIEAVDENKKTQYDAAIYSNKESVNTRQNFLITDNQNQIKYSDFYKADERLLLKSIRNTTTMFQVDYFKPQFKLAIPPFSLEPRTRFSYIPDSTYSVSKINEVINLDLPENGFLHLKTNEQTKEGVSFFVYESAFPKIKNTEQMILATRYIMAKKEFDKCINASDKKAAIDDFWVDIAGSGERAKELIKKYYNRVQEANKLFSSYQEGWKTDRGMIYTVFGAPNKVIKHKNGEQWVYGETNTPSSLTFSFIKIINPFTDNDYYLERNETYKMPWYQAVDMWRQGRIYLDN